MIRRADRAAIPLLLFLACTPFIGAEARAPSAAERAFIGTYYVGDAMDRRLCRIELGFAEDVGGEAVSFGCEKRAPELAEALRWWVNDADRSLRFSDPLRKVRAVFTESEGGYIAETNGGGLLTLSAYDQRTAKNPGGNVPGRWSFANPGGDDPYGGCFLLFAKTRKVTVSSKCPATLRGVSDGAWTVTETTITVEKKGARTVTLTRGASECMLFLPGGQDRLQRD